MEIYHQNVTPRRTPEKLGGIVNLIRRKWLTIARINESNIPNLVRIYMAQYL